MYGRDLTIRPFVLFEENLILLAGTFEMARFPRNDDAVVHPSIKILFSDYLSSNDTPRWFARDVHGELIPVYHPWAISCAVIIAYFL